MDAPGMVLMLPRGARQWVVVAEGEMSRVFQMHGVVWRANRLRRRAVVKDFGLALVSMMMGMWEDAADECYRYMCL